MKTTFLTLMIFIAFVYTSEAQTPSTTSLSSSLGLYVFPSKNQDKAKQDADESACYNWAKEQTGVDPINPPKVEAAQVDRSADGTAIRHAAGGAAAGAAIGAIAGDAGEGAAIGAVVGGLRGRRAKVVGDEKQQQQNNQNASAQQKELMANFNKAFTACIEGKGYTVK
ncbi:glycine zipper domain-containing protein [Gelidibacter sp.]|uniref:glycine zipper domain-containing protein n=1 Tax=Gelidibacter sp. TaxID=2018083 RepID=UPI002CAF2611|nr:glycine zipper domain-containing protein [Gelidibacter sp.]HUH27688.1 glycine zipper domain-containing protein [Gelidibacter sp.]